MSVVGAQVQAILRNNIGPKALEDGRCMSNFFPLLFFKMRYV